MFMENSRETRGEIVKLRLYTQRHSGMRPLGAGPESIPPAVVMDSGLALRAPRNDGLLFVVPRTPGYHGSHTD
jgi:hypothetical protein